MEIQQNAPAGTWIAFNIHNLTTPLPLPLATDPSLYAIPFSFVHLRSTDTLSSNDAFVPLPDAHAYVIKEDECDAIYTTSDSVASSNYNVTARRFQSRTYPAESTQTALSIALASAELYDVPEITTFMITVTAPFHVIEGVTSVFLNGAQTPASPPTRLTPTDYSGAVTIPVPPNGLRYPLRVTLSPVMSFGPAHPLPIKFTTRANISTSLTPLVSETEMFILPLSNVIPELGVSLSWLGPTYAHSLQSLSGQIISYNGIYFAPTDVLLFTLPLGFSLRNPTLPLSTSAQSPFILDLPLNLNLLNGTRVQCSTPSYVTDRLIYIPLANSTNTSSPFSFLPSSQITNLRFTLPNVLIPGRAFLSNLVPSSDARYNATMNRQGPYASDPTSLGTIRAFGTLSNPQSILVNQLQPVLDFNSTIPSGPMPLGGYSTSLPYTFNTHSAIYFSIPSSANVFSIGQALMPPMSYVLNVSIPLAIAPIPTGPTMDALNKVNSSAFTTFENTLIYNQPIPSSDDDPTTHPLIWLEGIDNSTSTFFRANVTRFTYTPPILSFSLSDVSCRGPCSTAFPPSSILALKWRGFRAPSATPPPFMAIGNPIANPQSSSLFPLALSPPMIVASLTIGTLNSVDLALSHPITFPLLTAAPLTDARLFITNNNADSPRPSLLNTRPDNNDIITSNTTAQFPATPTTTPMQAILFFRLPQSVTWNIQHDLIIVFPALWNLSPLLSSTLSYTTSSSSSSSPSYITIRDIPDDWSLWQSVPLTSSSSSLTPGTRFLRFTLASPNVNVPPGALIRLPLDATYGIPDDSAPRTPLAISIEFTQPTSILSDTSAIQAYGHAPMLLNQPNGMIYSAPGLLLPSPPPQVLGTGSVGLQIMHPIYSWIISLTFPPTLPPLIPSHTDRVQIYLHPDVFQTTVTGNAHVTASVRLNGASADVNLLSHPPTDLTSPSPAIDDFLSPSSIPEDTDVMKVFQGLVQSLRNTSSLSADVSVLSFPSYTFRVGDALPIADLRGQTLIIQLNVAMSIDDTNSTPLLPPLLSADDRSAAIIFRRLDGAPRFITPSLPISISSPSFSSFSASYINVSSSSFVSSPLPPSPLDHSVCANYFKDAYSLGVTRTATLRIAATVPSSGPLRQNDGFLVSLPPLANLTVQDTSSIPYTLTIGDSLYINASKPILIRPSTSPFTPSPSPTSLPFQGSLPTPIVIMVPLPVPINPLTSFTLDIPSVVLPSTALRLAYSRPPSSCDQLSSSSLSVRGSQTVTLSTVRLASLNASAPASFTRLRPLLINRFVPVAPMLSVSSSNIPLPFVSCISYNFPTLFHVSSYS